LESHIADCLILDNQEEIAILEFAQQKAKNDDVKQAAKQMIDDHRQAIQKLQRFSSRGTAGSSSAANAAGDRSTTNTAGTSGITAGAAADTAGATTGASGTSITSNDRAGARREARKYADGQNASGAEGRGVQASGAIGGLSGSVSFGGGDREFGQLHQMAERKQQECIRMTEQDLSKHEGAKFDKALVGQQCVMHTSMLAKLKSLDGQTSSEFNELAQQLAQTTQQHKDHLDKLMEELSAQAEKGSSSRR